MHVECLHVNFVGVCTSFPSEPPQYKQDRTESQCEDVSNKTDSLYSGLEFSVELNGYAEFGPFPPSCTSRGTSTAKDCGNAVESHTGMLENNVCIQ